MPVSSCDILGSDGPVARQMRSATHGFETRPQQLAMARAVAEALAAPRRDAESRAERGGGELPGGRLIVEAGTGVGKSFAYLVPAILRCLLRGERVVVATNTIALQEQIIQKDIPFLQETLPEWGLPETTEQGLKLPELKAVLVKGRGNYVSVRRLQLAGKRALTLFPDAPARSTLQAIEEWAYTTTDGTLSTAPAMERPSVWDRVQSDAANCMGRKCPTYARCFYQAARREMEEGNLLICNHALFFSDLALRAATDGEGGFLPDYHHVILDEAHNIEDVASEHFGLSLTEARVGHLLSILYQHRTGRGYLANVRAEGDPGPIDAAHEAVLKAENASRAFFDGLLDLLRRGGLPAGRIPAERSADVENTLTPAMKSLVLRLKTLREVVAGEEDKYELNAYILRAESIAEQAQALTQQSVPGSVYWIEASDADADLFSSARRAGSTAKVRIACSPVEVAPLLREHLFSQPHGIVLTSATLATRKVAPDEHPERAETAFAHFMSRLGIDTARVIQLDSPFDYARQARVYVDVTVPDPRAGSGGGGGWNGGAGGAGRAGGRRRASDDDFGAGSDAGSYPRALSRCVLNHIKATDGGAFVLFTSFATLYACADALEPELDELGMPLLVQGRGGSRSQILEKFRQDDRSVLLGAASFWQGVDVRGRNLRNVIITRLPFDPPDRPLTQARLDRIKDRGGNPFMEDSLPRAIIRFKQGFGRLIRSQQDTGRVVVLDPRIMTARYGRLFLDALPDGVRVEVLSDD